MCVCVCVYVCVRMRMCVCVHACVVCTIFGTVRATGGLIIICRHLCPRAYYINNAY